MEGNRRSLRGRASDLCPFVPFSFPSRLYSSIRLSSPLCFFFFKINEISAIVKPLAGIPQAHCYHPKNSKLEKDPLDEQKLNLGSSREKQRKSNHTRSSYTEQQFFKGTKGPSGACKLYRTNDYEWNKYRSWCVDHWSAFHREGSSKTRALISSTEALLPRLPCSQSPSLPRVLSSFFFPPPVSLTDFNSAVSFSVVRSISCVVLRTRTRVYTSDFTLSWRSLAETRQTVPLEQIAFIYLVTERNDDDPTWFDNRELCTKQLLVSARRRIHEDTLYAFVS